jgi:hypothetical protein
MKLQIREIVFEVFQFLWDTRLDLARMIAAPVFALTILQLILTALVPIRTPEEAQNIAGWQTFALIMGSLLSAAFYTMFAVAWHRRCLRPEEQTTILTALKWDHRKTLFLFRFIVISIVAAIGVLPVLIVISIILFAVAAAFSAGSGDGASVPAHVAALSNAFPVIALLIVFAGVMLIQTRLSLLLPATALDQKMTLMEAWAMGRDNTWRLFAIILLSIAPAMVIVTLVQSGVGAIGFTTGLHSTLTFRFVAQLAINFASYIAVAASVSALSMSYRALRQPPSGGMPYYM